MKILITLIFLLFFNQSYSDLYQCNNVNGGVSFSDVPCPASNKEKKLYADTDSRGFLKKYILPPSNSAMRARCLKDACICGSEIISINSNIQRQFLKSINSIPNAWYRLNREYQRQNNANTYVNQIQKVIACELTVHQHFFEEYYPRYLELKRQVEKSNTVNPYKDCGKVPQMAQFEDDIRFQKRYNMYQDCLKFNKHQYSISYEVREAEELRRFVKKSQLALEKLRID
ncbi:MAG: DUF4124 domain-containing protein [Oceanospirillaceae bacterium]|nr:DUF4124 domain-containing protein [Oceanospirillaceae bacterium]